MVYCSHYLSSHSIASFAAISPQTRRAPGSGGQAAGTGNSCDAANSGCTEATKPEGNTFCLGSAQAAHCWWLGKYCRETGCRITICDHHIALVLIPPGNCWRPDIRPGGSSIQPKAAAVTVLRLLLPLLMSWLGSAEGKERIGAAACPLLCPISSQLVTTRTGASGRCGQNYKEKKNYTNTKQSIKGGNTAKESSTSQQ